MLEEKTILVIGAGGLLGSHVVNALLRHNAMVIAADNNYAGMVERFGNCEIDLHHRHLSLAEVDITNESELVDFFAKSNMLSGAVNCTYPRNKAYGKHFLEVALADFNENVSLHLGSSFLFSQQCAKYFIRTKKPFSLINISSIYGLIAPKFDIYANTSMTMPVEYAAIKSALIHLAKYIVSYIGNSDFRINTVSPGGIFDSQPETFLKSYKEQTLGKGMLDIEDITGAIIFLLSEHSRYMNAQNLVIDDGFSL